MRLESKSSDICCQLPLTSMETYPMLLKAFAPCLLPTLPLCLLRLSLGRKWDSKMEAGTVNRPGCKKEPPWACWRCRPGCHQSDSCDCFLVASRIELHNRICWHSDPCHVFLWKRVSVPATAGIWYGIFNLWNESGSKDLLRRDEGLLLLHQLLLSTRGVFTTNSLLSLGQMGVPQESFYSQRLIKGAITPVAVICVPTFNRISDLS